jgi:hypothetical protein
LSPALLSVLCKQCHQRRKTNVRGNTEEPHLVPSQCRVPIIWRLYTLVNTFRHSCDRTCNNASPCQQGKDGGRDPRQFTPIQKHRSLERCSVNRLTLDIPSATLRGSEVNIVQAFNDR